MTITFAVSLLLGGFGVAIHIVATPNPTRSASGRPWLV